MKKTKSFEVIEPNESPNIKRSVEMIDYSIPRIVEVAVTDGSEAEDVLSANGFKESQCSWMESEERLHIEYSKDPNDEQWFICIRTYTDARLDYSIIEEGEFLKGKDFDPCFKGYYRKATPEEIAGNEKIQ